MFPGRMQVARWRSGKTSLYLQGYRERKLWNRSAHPVNRKVASIGADWLAGDDPRAHIRKAVDVREAHIASPSISSESPEGQVKRCSQAGPGGCRVTGRQLVASAKAPLE